MDPSAAWKVYEMTAEKYTSKWKKTAPKKLLEEWTVDLNCQEEKNLKMLAGMAVSLPETAGISDALLMGEEGDLKRCNGKTFSADAVQLMTAPWFQRAGISRSASIRGRKGRASPGKRKVSGGYRGGTAAFLCRDDQGQRRADPDLCKRALAFSGRTGAGSSGAGKNRERTKKCRREPDKPL